MADAHMSRADSVGFCQVQQAVAVDNHFPDNLSSRLSPSRTPHVIAKRLSSVSSAPNALLIILAVLSAVCALAAWCLQRLCGDAPPVTRQHS